jgi:regulator of protease activity HflC (stomatin/prohibitin superfamily)
LRLGRYAGTRGPGLFFIIPGVDKLIRVSLRTVVMDVPPQDVITHDNVTVKVSAVIYFRVIEPEKAIIEVENFLYATSQLSQTTLRSVLGQVELDELLANREKINRELQEILDRHAGPWGVKVSNVEVKNIDLPQEMMRAIAKQAEAERERRAKIIHAEGELQASEKLAKAAIVLAQEPMSLQLRFLQTLTEIGAEKNSTIVFPVPIDIIKMFLDK